MALRTKGETVDELDGLSRTALEFAKPVRAGAGRRHVRDRRRPRAARSTSRRSRAIVVAGAGVPVAKHGNRAASSHCGSADLLEALGVKIDLDPAASNAAWRRPGSRSCSRPCSTRQPPRRAVRSELRVPDRVQLPGPAHEPGPALRAGGRRLGREDAAAAGRGARAPRDPREGVPRRGRPRRAHHHGPLDRVRRRATAISGRSISTPWSSGSRGRRVDDLRGGDAANAARRPRCPRWGARSASRRRAAQRRSRDRGGRAYPGSAGRDGRGGGRDRLRSCIRDARAMDRGLERVTPYGPGSITGR